MKFSHLIRLYSSIPIYKNQALKIEGEDFHYLKSVIRLRKSDTFRLFNESGGEFLARIDDVAKTYVNISLADQIRSIETEKELILGICLIKPDRMIEVIKSAVQLGVTKIFPLLSERTQYKKINREKFEKSIIQSTEQSERFKPAELSQEMQLADFCKLDRIEQIIFALESEEKTNKISDIKKIKEKVAVLIGPEGGFSEQEIGFVKSYNHVCSVSLGNTVLRTETAATAALACVQMVRDND